MSRSANLEYCAETGAVTWEDTGARAGYLHKTLGYWMFFHAKTVMYFQHRLIWEAFHGPIPKGMYVDHINRDRADNRLVNLRLVTIEQSQANRGTNSRNTSGHKWVDWDKSRQRWRVQLVDLGGKRHLKDLRI